jgi:hypothetical protein
MRQWILRPKLAVKSSPKNIQDKWKLFSTNLLACRLSRLEQIFVRCAQFTVFKHFLFHSFSPSPTTTDLNTFNLFVIHLPHEDASTATRWHTVHSANTTTFQRSRPLQCCTRCASRLSRMVFLWLWEKCYTRNDLICWL